MEQAPDRRIRKTKQAVQSALLSLMNEKNLSEITVRELTAKADINRKTFYNHYTDIYAVLDEMEDERIDRILSLLSENVIRSYVENPSLFFETLLRELRGNEEFYLTLIRSDAYSGLTRKLVYREKAVLTDLIRRENIEMDPLWLEYFLIFIANGSQAVIHSWIQADMPVPLESLASFFEQIFRSSEIRRSIIDRNESSQYDRNRSLQEPGIQKSFLRS